MGLVGFFRSLSFWSASDGVATANESFEEEALEVMLVVGVVLMDDLVEGDAASWSVSDSSLSSIFDLALDLDLELRAFFLTGPTVSSEVRR